MITKHCKYAFEYVLFLDHIIMVNRVGNDDKWFHGLSSYRDVPHKDRHF